MLGPNNTMTMKVMSMKEDGEEWMVEKRVITEMVYWDMVGHPVFIVVDIVEEPDGVAADGVIFSGQGVGLGHSRRAASARPLGCHNGNSTCRTSDLHLS